LITILLDDRTVGYLSRNLDNGRIRATDKEQSRLLHLSMRYLSLLPVTINSLVLQNGNQVNLGSEIVNNTTLNLEEEKLWNRFNKIETQLYRSFYQCWKNILLSTLQNIKSTIMEFMLHVKLCGFGMSRGT
jgi:hypothetical protein